MKNLLKYILETIGVMTSLLFPQSIYNAIADIKSHIYTGANATVRELEIQKFWENVINGKHSKAC